MTLSEVEPIHASPLPAEFSELREHPDHFSYTPLGQTTAEALPLQKGIVMAIGVYSVTNASEALPSEVFRHGLIGESTSKVVDFGRALLNNHKEAVALSQMSRAAIPHLEAIAKSAYDRVNQNQYRYEKGIPSPRTVLLGGYLFSPHADRHAIGVFTNDEIMPSVRLGIEDVGLRYKYHFLENRTHPSEDLRTQTYLIPGEHDPDVKIQAFRETIAGLMVASRVEAGLAALQSQTQTQTEAATSKETAVADVIMLPLAA